MNTVWVLVHEHKHGMDVSVHRSREGADAAAVRLIVAHIDKVEGLELRARLGDLIARGQRIDALQLWQSEVGTPEGEVLRIVERPLEP